MYKDELSSYLNLINGLDHNTTDDILEFNFESLKDWSSFHSIDYIKNWYRKQVDSSSMTVREIPLDKCDGWIVNSDKISHTSGEFFSVKGVEVKSKTREASGGWSQPIIEQVAKENPLKGGLPTDGGILGIIRKKFDGVPHYLLEAKFEPGNVNLVQFSPTLQATLSNMSAVHKGYKPHYLDYFLNTDEHKVHFSNWLCEDGGRLYNKRNLNMLIEVDKPIQIVNDNFIWMSLYQIRYLIKKYDWVNSHVRGIFSFI